MKKIIYIAALAVLSVLALSVSQNAAAQKRTISGIVVGSDNNAPLPGVAIHLKEDATIFTLTDNNGSYSLDVPGNEGTVIFEMLGYDTKEIKLSESPVLFTVVTMIIQASTLPWTRWLSWVSVPRRKNRSWVPSRL